MIHNPITEEIREIRHRLAAQFDNDVSRIGAEIRRGQAISGRRVVRRPRRQPVVSNTMNQSTLPTEMGSRSTYDDRATGRSAAESTG
jgi:hypothetical protein